MAITYAGRRRVVSPTVRRSAALAGRGLEPPGDSTTRTGDLGGPASAIVRATWVMAGQAEGTCSIVAVTGELTGTLNDGTIPTPVRVTGRVNFPRAGARLTRAAGHWGYLSFLRLSAAWLLSPAVRRFGARLRHAASSASATERLRARRNSTVAPWRCAGYTELTAPAPTIVSTVGCNGMLGEALYGLRPGDVMTW